MTLFRVAAKTLTRSAALAKMIFTANLALIALSICPLRTAALQLQPLTSSLILKMATFLGTNGVFIAGFTASLQIISTATGFTILGETNGDGKADFSINITEADHSTVWSFGDFLT